MFFLHVPEVLFEIPHFDVPPNALVSLSHLDALTESILIQRNYQPIKLRQFSGPIGATVRTVQTNAYVPRCGNLECREVVLDHYGDIGSYGSYVAQEWFVYLFFVGESFRRDSFDK